VQPGAAVTFDVDTTPGRAFTGTVRFVSPTISASQRALTVEAIVPNADHALAAGAFVSARIGQGTTSSGLFVPTTAIIGTGTATRVFVVTGDHVETRLVTTGVTQGTTTEITSGLAAGERVATTHLDQLADGSIDLTKNAVYQNWLATFNMMNKHNQAKPNLTDTEYDLSVADLASGKAGFWFMGNWAEPNLLTASPNTNFGIMPLPISDDAKAYGNNSISVGIPGYFMIDEKQSTKEQRAGAIDFLTWLYTSEKGQARVAGPVESGGMNFIPVYKGFKIEPKTYMAREISKYVTGCKTLEWINTYYPAGGQDLYGASGQKLMTGAITGEQYAAELQAAWKGAVKKWRGVKK